MPHLKGFASDNYAGIAPEIMTAISEANSGQAAPYGEDPYTAALIACVKKNCGDAVTPFLVFNGTAANTLGLQALTQRHHAILTSDISHILTHETGAPTAWIGAQILAIPHEMGKLTPSRLEASYLQAKSAGKHASLPKVVSIAETTEIGTVYTLTEIQALKAVCTRFGLYLYMDGARLANAAAALNVSLHAFAEDTGIDVFSFGGTKNGLMLGELLIFVNPLLATEFEYKQKQGLQLASKMRFLSTQFLAYFHNDLWLKNAKHANDMAALLASGLSALQGVRFPYGPPQSNQFWVHLPTKILPALHAEYAFYQTGDTGLIRLVTSFATLRTEVEGFIQLVQDLIHTTPLENLQDDII